MKRLFASVTLLLALTVTAMAQGVEVPSTFISFGSIAGNLLGYVAVAIVPIVGGFIVNWLVKAAALFRVTIKDADRARLQEMVENGIKWAAQKLGIALNGKLSFDVKSKIIAAVVHDYLPKNAAETVAKLGGNVNDFPAMTAIVSARGADTLELPAEVRAVAKMAGAETILAGPLDALKRVGIAPRKKITASRG